MTLKDFNWKTLIAIGLLAGLIQVATGVVMYVAGVYFASWSMLVSVFVLLLCIVLGTRWYRDSVQKGQITVGQALVAGIVISICTGVIYAIYNVVSISFFYPQFLEDLIRIARLPERVTANTIALSNLIRLSVIGAILSLFASLVLKRTASSN